MEKTDIIAEIQRLAERLGETPGKGTFEKETGIPQGEWLGRFWARWSDAVEEAGLQANSLQIPYDREFVIAKFIELVRILRKWPVQAELTMKARENQDFPSRNTITKHLGNASQRAATILEYCEERSGFEDVIEICRPLVETTSTDDPQIGTTSIDGYVYLIKSGKYYKIGSTNKPDRRLYEIGLQLPEEVVLIHSIETDDPSGIEAYWHKRFADKRLKGEWFDLSKDEIRVFKRRRKFM